MQFLLVEHKLIPKTHQYLNRDLLPIGILNSKWVYPKHAGFDGVFINFDGSLHSVALWVDQKGFPWGS